MNTKFCFILGIMPRSGTNYLYQLLEKHPEIVTLDPIYEDFLVHHSSLLVTYASNVYRSFGSKYRQGIENRFGSSGGLLEQIGNGMLRFLTQPLSNAKDGGYYLLKTPSVEGLDNFFEIFPDQRLILLVRDGRSVVESGIRSFGWEFEQSVRDWDVSARHIKKFSETTDRQKFHIVIYEDLVTNTEDELTKIFTFLNLDVKAYDFAAAEHQAIVGSSENKNKDGSVNWTPKQRYDGFNPIERWNEWTRGAHERFNWLAGDSMKIFGYVPLSFPSSYGFYVIYNKCLDIWWPTRVSFKKIVGFLKNIFKQLG